MMQKKIRSAISMCVLSGLFMSTEIVFGQPDENPKIAIIRTDESTREVLQKSRPKTPDIGEVARYTLKEGNNRFLLQLGGFIKPIMGWDIGNALDDISFVPSQLPVPAKKGNKVGYFINPLHSALNLQIVGLPGTEHEIAGFLHMMYNGPRSTVQIHHVYFTYRGFLLGKTNSIFEDGNSIPETIDPQGPNGAVSTSAFRISWERAFHSGLSLGIGLEIPTFDKYPGRYEGRDYPDLDDTQYYGDASQPIPDLPGYVQYQGKGKNYIRLSGIMRNFFYRDECRDQTESIMGWGVQLGGTLQPVKPLVFYYQGTYGKGIGNYIQDFQTLPLSYIPKDKEPGKMTPSPMAGWLAGVSYEFENGLSMRAMYSQTRIWGSSAYYPGYRYGQYFAANLFYPLKDYLTLGVEYIRGKHAEFGDDSASLNRIQTMLKFSF